MDPLKKAFIKIKEEILLLKDEIRSLNEKINTIQTAPKYNPTYSQTTPTHNQPQTHSPTNTQTHFEAIPTHNKVIQPLYTQNTAISTGNEGVPTNTQTHQQTHKHTQNIDFKQANDILESLDTIKKEIRLKFKRLTPQEMIVFSTLYTLDEQDLEITYKIIATQLNLSESSIRDYINKLINKGIPIEKSRKNNKTIILKVSQDLKNIATLATIQTLRTL